jgi:hypothetical protein
MEDNTMSPDAATSPSSGMGTGTQMNPDKSDKEDDSSY